MPDATELVVIDATRPEMSLSYVTLVIVPPDSCGQYSYLVSPLNARVGNQAFDAATSLTPGGVLPVTATVPEMAVESFSSDTFLGARNRRLARRRGKPKAIVATSTRWARAIYPTEGPG